MSWSICFIGKPENVVTALEQESEKLNGQSKVEYDAALPHFIGLVKQNFGANVQNVKIAADGHGVESGENSSRNCCATLEYIYGTLV